MRADERLGDCRAPSTWDNISAIMNQFHLFDANQTSADYIHLALDWRMAAWIEHKVAKGELNRGSPVQYAKKMQQAYREIFGEPSSVLRDLAAGLRRRPDATAMGAIPLPEPQFRLLLSRCRHPDVYHQILIQWMTASRTDDMNRLRRQDFDIDGETVKVTWNLGTKGSQMPFTDIISLPAGHTRALGQYLTRFGSDDKVFSLSSDTLTAIIRAQVGPQYSSHSIKKGALVHLIEMGHPLTSVAYKAKHRSIDLLRVYIGPTAWAKAHNAPQMAADLRGSLA